MSLYLVVKITSPKYQPKVPSSFEVPPLPVIEIVLQLGSLGEAIFHTISVGYQFQPVYSWAR